jgi:hypothetical protein
LVLTLEPRLRVQEGTLGGTPSWAAAPRPARGKPRSAEQRQTVLEKICGDPAPLSLFTGFGNGLDQPIQLALLLHYRGILIINLAPTNGKSSSTQRVV